MKEKSKQKQKPKGYWGNSIKNCRIEALKYTKRSIFSRESSGAYDSARRNGWLDGICGHMEIKQKTSGYWTKERCLNVAKNYKYKKGLKENYSRAYSLICENGWLDEACSHMEKDIRVVKIWSKDNCRIEALKYETRKKFQIGSASCYQMCFRKKWLDIVCVHMVSGRKKTKWSKDNCRTEALKYENRTSFKKGSYSAWYHSNKNGWLDDFLPIKKKESVEELFKKHILKNDIDVSDIPSSVNVRDFTNYDHFRGSYKSLYELVDVIYPNKFKQWEFNSVVKGFWEDDNNVYKYLKWFENRVGIKKEEDWYRIKRDLFRKHNGYGLYSLKFKQTLLNIVQFLYPCYEWLEWKFLYTTKNYWKDERNIFKYLKWFENKAGIKKEEDWYSLNSYDLLSAESIFSTRFGYSVIRVSEYLYPGYKWLVWKFEKTHNNFWQDGVNIVKYLKWFESEMDIKEASDWYNISIEIISNKKGSGLFGVFGTSIYPIVKYLYPDYGWKKEKFNSKHKRQNIITEYIRNNYSGEILVNHKHKDIIFDSGKRGELDIYLPELNIAFEINGIQHYEYHTFFHRSEKDFLDQQERDCLKNDACLDLGIDLKTIYYKDCLDSVFGSIDKMIEVAHLGITINEI